MRRGIPKRKRVTTAKRIASGRFVEKVKGVVHVVADMSRAEAANFLGNEPTEKIIVGQLISRRPQKGQLTTDDLVAKVEKGEADLAAGLGKIFTLEELDALVHESA